MILKFSNYFSVKKVTQESIAFMAGSGGSKTRGLG